MHVTIPKSAQVLTGHDPLTAAEIMNPQRYEESRDLFLCLGRQHKINRRLRLNDYFSIVFETRFTVWLQIQEEARWHTEHTEHRISKILAANNPLIAPSDEFRACLFVDNLDPRIGSDNTSSPTISHLNLQLALSGEVYQSQTLDSEEDTLDAVSFLRFRHTGSTREPGCWLKWSLPVPGMCTLPTHVAQTILSDLTLKAHPAMCA